MKKENQYYLAIHQLIQTGHWITDQVGQVLKKHDISEPQFNVLRILKGRNGIAVTVQEIQSEMIQRTSNVTRIIDKLLSKGFVQRKECPTNRRKMDITITKEGLKYLEILDHEVQSFHQPMQKNLTIEEAKTIVKLIKKLKGER